MGKSNKTEASDEVKDNRYRYAGYQYDEETGLYYLMARYYEPETACSYRSTQTQVATETHWIRMGMLMEIITL